MVDWYNIAVWSLIGTWALVVGTLFLLYWQTRSDRHLNSANAVMALRERFDGERMRAARRHLAERLLKRDHDDIASMEVITFFELVGTLTHRGILDHELVWEAFGTWISCYYWAARHPEDLIGKLRQDLRDPLVFHEFEWLFNAIEGLDVKHLGARSADVDPESYATQMLQREVRLGAI